MASKQTAVEWLVEQLEQHHTSIDIKNTVVFQQAKAMEKEQIVETYNEGALDGLQLGEKYYNFVYGKQLGEQYYNFVYNS